MAACPLSRNGPLTRSAMCMTRAAGRRASRSWTWAWSARCTRTAGQVRVELLLTSGWCPFASRVLTEVQERIEAQPGVAAAEVEIVWDEAWTTDRLSERAAGLLRFLPPPAQAGDRAAYLAAHQPARGDQP